MYRATETTMNKPLTLIQPQKGKLHFGLKSLWQYRELLYFLVWRDVLVRYKQTLVGASWAILQPLLTMAIFTVIFGRLANIPSEGKPYPVFTFAALLPWNLFSQALLRSGSSLVGNANLITKVYFPRLLIPLSASAAPLVDLFFSLVVLISLMLWYQLAPTWGIILLPLFVFQSFLAALAVGLWLTTLNVKYRDVSYIIPFLTQAWMYASPVAYPARLVPEKWRILYSLNPMVGAIEGFRWAILGSQRPDFSAIAISFVVIAITLLGGVIYFKHTERTFADII